jgi:hypothetical protein
VANWFVRIEDLKAGPFSDREFFDFLKDKDPAGMEIWREGMSAWVPAADIPQLVEMMSPGGAPAAKRRISPAQLWIAAFAAGFVLLAGIAAALIIPHLISSGKPAVTEAPVEKEASVEKEAPAEKQAPTVTPEPPPPAPAPAPVTRLSREEFADSMRQSMALLDALQKRFPSLFDELISEFYDKLSNGYPEAETAIAMRRKAFTMIKALLPLADDDVLLALNKVIGEKYRVLTEQNPSLCYAFGTGVDSPEISAAFPEDLLRRERDLYERAIATATSRTPADQRRISNLQAALRRALVAGGVSESQLSLLDAPNVAPEQYAQYCEVTTRLFGEIGKLPPEDAVAVMRILMSGK